MSFEETVDDGQQTWKTFISIFHSVGQYPVEQNQFSNFGRGLCKEQFCEIILKSSNWLERGCLKNLLFLALVASCSMELNQFSNFGTGPWEKHFYSILFKYGFCTEKRHHLKIFLFLPLVATLFNGTKPFQQFWYRAITGIFVQN